MGESKVSRMPNTESVDELVNAAVAGTILKRTPRQVARLVAEGKLAPATKLAGRTGAYVFRRADVERFAAERVQPGGDAA